MTWREVRLAAIREGIAAAIPCLVIWPDDTGGFFACWRENGEGVGVTLSPTIPAEDVPPVALAVHFAVESLMNRAPIAGHA